MAFPNFLQKHPSKLKDHNLQRQIIISTIVNYIKLPATMNNPTLVPYNGGGRGLVSTKRHASASSVTRKETPKFMLSLMFAISVCLSMVGVSGVELGQEDNKFASSTFHDQINICR